MLRFYLRLIVPLPTKPEYGSQLHIADLDTYSEMPLTVGTLNHTFCRNTGENMTFCDFQALILILLNSESCR